MILTDIVSFALRIGELAFSSVIAGLTGQYLHQTRHSASTSRKRFIYTEVIAALSILFTLLFLFPFASSFLYWPIDFLLFAGTMVSFGLLAHYNHSCGSVWNWHGITHGGQCDKFKADIAFLFLASVLFLASALLGVWVTHWGRRGTATVESRRERKGWFRKSRY
ncbi:unnamed protein product [Diplocarpon coronariae]|uniref:MARVEL domain-containing protein n=1 Tax=Diplocarpon coronariae TaxID=2795749 RepID=A0A218ZBJ5_9HELO|nr:integral membrane protein [Diplocarpon mali]OWP05094.1 hypothetical protein B2J93_8307 [Marssonina coronariae]